MLITCPECGAEGEVGKVKGATVEAVSDDWTFSALFECAACGADLTIFSSAPEAYPAENPTPEDYDLSCSDVVCNPDTEATTEGEQA